MIRGVDHRVGAESRLVADPQTAVAVHVAAVVEGDPVTKFDPVAVQPDDQVEVEAALTDSLRVVRAEGITRFERSVIIIETLPVADVASLAGFCRVAGAPATRSGRSGVGAPTRLGRADSSVAHPAIENVRREPDAPSH